MTSNMNVCFLSQVTLHSAKLVVKHIQDISALFPKESVSGVFHSLKKHVLHALVTVLSYNLKALHQFSKEGIHLTSDILHTVTDLSLVRLTGSRF